MITVDFHLFSLILRGEQKQQCLYTIYYSTFGSKIGSINGSKLATLMGVMCYAQDNSIELQSYRPARKCLTSSQRGWLNSLFNSFL